MENCIFCKIISGKIPANKVWEDKNHLAFLNIRPIKKGHTLIIPKKHTNYVFDLRDSELSDLVLVAKKVAGVIKLVQKPKSGKVSMLTMGIGVPHVHIHLIPLDSEDDINAKNAYDASPQELSDIAQKYQKALS